MEVPQIIKPPGWSPYLWATVILTLGGAIFVLLILRIRPSSEATDVIIEVGKVLAPTTAGVLAFMKSQETHLMVNSRLSLWMETQSKLSRSEGIAQGISDEQARIGTAAVVIATSKSDVEKRE